MAATINADNGSVSGSAGLKSSADSSGVLQLQTNGTAAVTVDASQNVGIGTASPSTHLHVYGAGTTSTSYTNGDAAGATLTLQDSAGASGNGGQILFGASQGFYAGIKGFIENGTGPAGSLLFQTRTTSGNIVERMRITSTGSISFGSSGTAYGTSGQVLTSAGNASPTWTTATNANTASAIVQRDASGNFSAGTITAALSGNATTAGGFTPSATAGVGNRIVVADSNGYIFNTYFNSTDNAITSGVTAIMAKQGSDYYRSASAAAVAAFVSGQSIATTGNISGTNTVGKSFNAGNAVIGNGAGGLNTLEVLGTGNAAMMTFHRPGAFAGYFGLDSDNVWKVGGWSYGAASYPLLYTGSATAPGSAPVYAARAWVNFNAVGTVTIRSSGNVSSITDNGVGQFTLNFATAMTDANYSVTGSCGSDAASSALWLANGSNIGGRVYNNTTTSCVIQTPYTTSLVADPVAANIAVFR